MILDVFDKNRLRIGTITKYEYSKYILSYKDAKDFEVKIKYGDEVMSVINEIKYVLFDEESIGIVTYINTKEPDVTIKGFMLKFIASFRCINKTKTFNNISAVNACIELINDNFTNASGNRKVDYVVPTSESSFLPTSENITVQKTGDLVIDAMNDILLPQDMFFDVVPILENVKNEQGDIIANISKFEFRFYKCVDRSDENTDGNDAILFSRTFGNLLSFEYTQNSNEYKNFAYVFGEGEGSERKSTTVSTASVSGLDRIEMYVDARDVQSQTDEGILTSSEYIALLKTRGSEKLSEHKKIENVLSELNQYDDRFIFKSDYNVGDYVTVIDEEQQIAVKLRVSEVTIYNSSKGESVDIQFGDDIVSIRKMIKKGGLL